MARRDMKSFLVNAGLTIAAIFAPAKEMMLTALVLILVDLVTGVMASRKEGSKITSAGFRRTVSKLLVYESAIALAFLAQHYLMNDTIPAASIVSGFVGLTELTSCLENINILGGNDMLKSIIKKLGSANQDDQK